MAVVSSKDGGKPCSCKRRLKSSQRWTVGKGEAQVPADRKQDHLRFKPAPLEQTGN